ncbi:MAG: ATP synthase A1 subunit C [Candidatus Woesearchaeota archaeon]
MAKAIIAGAEMPGENIEKVRLREYPYTYARVSVMKARLIKRDGYYKVLKMGINDITRFLQDTEYKREIDELASSRSGVDLIESALNANLIRTVRKLKRISEDEGLARVINAYMMRKDIWNIKAILRGVHSGQEKEMIMDLLVPVGALGEEYLSALADKQSVEEIISSLKFMRFDNLKEVLPGYREKGNLFDLENAIDKDYYSYLLAFARKLPRQGHLFRQFVENEIDIINIRILLRLKQQGLSGDEIGKYFLCPGARLGRKDLDRLAGMDSTESIINAMKRAGYGFMPKGVEKKESLMEIELVLNKHLLDKAALLLHQHPLSVDVILGYMFAKEIEIRNLKTIIKGKQLGMQEDFIEKEIVM